MTRTVLLTATLLLTPAAAGASHPEPRAMARVQLLAHEVEEASRHVHREAERHAHHHDYWEERSLRRLHELEESARHFHRQVERYLQDPYHTEADFRRLARAHYEAQEALHWLHAYDHVRRDFYQVERAMGELLRYYGYDEGYYGREHHSRGARGRWYLPRVELRWGWRWPG